MADPDLGDLVAAFLGFWAPATPATVRLWCLALTGTDAARHEIEEALAIWLRCEDRLPVPRDITALIASMQRPDSMHSIVVHTAMAHGFTLAEMAGPKKSRELTAARADAVWRMRQRGYSQTQIGRMLGRDHTTIGNLERVHLRGVGSGVMQ